jgi:hypothetical protein
VALENWAARWTATLKSSKWTKQHTKREGKTKQKQQRSKENTKTRRGEKERQSLSLIPDKVSQGGRENPTKEAAFKASLSKQARLLVYSICTLILF